MSRAIAVTLVVCGLAVGSSGMAQTPMRAWDRTTPFNSIQEWDSLVVVWFHETFSARSRLVLVDKAERLHAMRDMSPIVPEALRVALASDEPSCKSAIKSPCVSPGEAILRFAPVRPQESSGPASRWATGVWVVRYEQGRPRSNFYAVRFEGQPGGPVRLISAVTASH